MATRLTLQKEEVKYPCLNELPVGKIHSMPSFGGEVK
jgi:hypothetical protein